jgi:hypothetical protein
MKQFIICPECGAIELATVIKNELTWWTYIHRCSKCEYVIMESEWNTAKAISIKQPYAGVVAAGIKDVENRVWKTNFRGRVLIHTGIAMVKGTFGEQFSQDQRTELVHIALNYGIKLAPITKTKSAIIGSVEIVDCIQNSDSIWALPNNWHWVLKNPIFFNEPILNVKGHLSFFTPQLP